MPVSPTIATRSNGQVIDQTWFNVLKTAADDHEDRIAVLETEAFVITLNLVGYLGSSAAIHDAALQWVNQHDMTVTDVEFFVHTAGSAGTYTIDVERKRGGGAWTSILSTLPTVAYTAGNNSMSTNGVVNASYDDIDAADLMRINIDGVQTDGVGLTVYLYCTKGN